MHLFDPAKLARLDDSQRLKQIPVEKLAKYLDLADGKVLADVGSGSGLFTFALASYVMPGGRVIGFDVQKECIEYSKDKLSKSLVPNVSFIQNGLESIPAEDSSIDAVSMILIAHEIASPEEFYAELLRVMKPGSKLALIDWQAKETSHGPNLKERISLESLLALLNGFGFEFIHQELINDENYMLVVKKTERVGD